MKDIFHDLYNLVMLIIVFNSAVYGIYYWEGFRGLVEKLCPPLTGWQFNPNGIFLARFYGMRHFSGFEAAV